MVPSKSAKTQIMDGRQGNAEKIKKNNIGMDLRTGCFMVRCSSLRAPLFVIPIGKIAKDGGSCTYLGLGYTVDLKKQADPEYGGSLRSVEMKLFGRVIAASIT